MEFSHARSTPPIAGTVADRASDIHFRAGTVLEGHAFLIALMLEWLRCTDVSM